MQHATAAHPEGRVVTDIRDAMFCVMTLVEEEERVPLELQAAVLDEQIMLAFWKGVKEWFPMITAHFSSS